jgi:hypothetical protein
MKKHQGLTFFSMSVEEKPTANLETLNSNFNLPRKIFSSVDLWNIQRQRRSMVQRRFSF